MPQISLIIPIYNTEKYLRKCLDSVCNQTLSDIEIICVNDCSKDGSQEILKEYSSKDKRIKLIELFENCGAAKARNIGIDIAQGEYIGFLDSDDFVDLDFYEKLYNKAIETNADTVKGNIYDVDENGQNPKLTNFYNMNERIKRNKAYFCYGFTSAIYRTSLILDNNIKFPVNITHFEDPYFSILASIVISNIQFVNSAKYYYIRHRDSACHTCKTEQKVKDFYKITAHIYDILNQKMLSKDEYSIYIAFLLENLIPYCSDINIPEQGNIQAINLLSKFLINTSFPLEDILQTYFLSQKDKTKRCMKQNNINLIKQLRERVNK